MSLYILKLQAQKEKLKKRNQRLNFRNEEKSKELEKLKARHVLDSLLNLYKKYRAEGGRYGFTTFHKYKPFYVLPANLSARDTCLCVKHSNVEFQQTALKKAGALSKDVKAVLSDIVCDTDSYFCMYNKCDECTDRKVQYNENDHSDDDKVSWFRWEREDHMYLLKE